MRAGFVREDMIDELAGARAARVEREREFYDAKSAIYHALRRLIWRAIGEFRRVEEATKYFDPKGKTVLDYGCGFGGKALTYVAMGAEHVTGIDISEERVREAQRRAAEAGVGDKVRFVVADAHATGLPDASFDLIVGKAILHHLDLKVAVMELRRLLRPGGTAIFAEPLWHNPLLRLGRALTPAARTKDEHPITAADWRDCAAIFPNFRHYERELITVPLMPVNLVIPRRWQRPLASRLAPVDDWLLDRFPSLRPYARISFMVFG
jgi:ubiquinone/menaquinone biosynthesis C-methylase UbiE